MLLVKLEKNAYICSVKRVTINGVEIKIGDKVRFINDVNLYVHFQNVYRPRLRKVYTVRDINELGGFLLEEVINVNFEWYSLEGKIDLIAEPGFANWRFEPQKPVSKKRKIVWIKIIPQVQEGLYEPPKKAVKRTPHITSTNTVFFPIALRAANL